MASSSSSNIPQARSIASSKLYDAFISHRGPDVKETLAKQLYERLQERGYQAFLDRKELEGGDSIHSAIHNAICSSRVQIAIFSKGYAQSSWCLDELVLMLQQTDALFIPVFYGVHPWELRHINSKSQYAAAFSDYQRKGRNLDKLDDWKNALVSASNISGYELSQHEDNLCDEIVSRVEKEMTERIPLHVAKYPVGLVDLVQDFEMYCSENRARDKAQIVGIFGLGGAGKTTLARELYNRKRFSYTASCFLHDVRESHTRRDLHSLQSKLLKDLFRKEWNGRSVYEGMETLKDNLGRAKKLHLHFLVVLDDINHQDQLDALIPEGVLGSGSLVIITTRDQSVLRDADICYRMKAMDNHHAKELFCSHAFRRRDPAIAYEKLIESFVEFCGGLPLSLIVLGAHLYGRNEDYWELELEKVRNIPHRDIMQSLKISFDGLDSQEKQIFVDVACFFNGNTEFLVKEAAISIWKASGWSAELAVQTLQEKCLIELDMDDRFEVHDHLRDLGRQLAEEMEPARLWKPEILRSMEPRGFKEILANKGPRCFHQFTDSTLETHIAYFIGSSNDSTESELLWLGIGNYDGISKPIPPWIPLQKLRSLHVSHVKELWSTFQQQTHTNAKPSFEMRVLTISDSPSENLPVLIGMFSHLEELHIEESLENTEITSLLQSLHLCNLKVLDLFDCGLCSNGILNFSCRMNRLENIVLRSSGNISKLVISGDMCPKLRSLQVNWMENLKEINLKDLRRLNDISVYMCSQLETISGLSSEEGLQLSCKETKSSISSQTQKLQSSLGHINIGDCCQLRSIEGVEELEGLKSLVIYVRNNCLWNCICGLKRLPSECTVISGKAVPKAKRYLNVKLFSGVIDDSAVAELESGEYALKMRSSFSAITIYAFLVVTSFPSPSLSFQNYKIWTIFPDEGEWMVTGILTLHDSNVNLIGVKIQKGFIVTIDKIDEGKALNVLQRIVDRLYRENVVSSLAAYDVVKRRRKY